ncbi:MAG TPA: holo-ACP synthase [Alphaproteobacteria bacterium]|nr:holo-ACP synthase [Alphaproteobacteria bacterium]
MIVGLGTDLTDIRRIEKAFDRFGNAFAKRIFTEGEQAYCNAKPARKRMSSYAARFAAKEACSKALGSGIRGISWTEMEIVSRPDGKPELILTGNALKRLRDLAGEKGSIHVSLSDEMPYAMATVILSTDF